MFTLDQSGYMIPSYDVFAHFETSDDYFITEENINLTHFKRHRLNMSQPVTGGMHQCTMVLMSNLDKPDWVSANCFEALIPSVACVIKEKNF